MNPTAVSFAQATFQAALSSGTSTAPIALSQLLAQLSANSQPQVFDAEAVGHSTGDEFPFLRSMIASGRPPDSAASAAWEAGVRWVLSALRNWDSNEVNSLNKLRALLGAIAALDAKSAGLSSVAAQVASNQLTAGLHRLVESSDVGPGFSEGGFPEFRAQITSFANSGNLEQLWRMVPHMNFFPAPDFWTAVVFMYSADPTELAGIIEKRIDVLFSLMICTVLGIQAIALASRVNNLVFKFVSVANLWQDRTAGLLQSSQSALETLLIQVARTSAADWAAWMQALYKYPGNKSLDAALAAVLHELSRDQWEAFFKALSLRYSRRAAAPVAEILSPFHRLASREQHDVMWSIAYQVWSDWNYGQHESDHTMFAPVACALDFPVAMYYASLASDVRLAEESNLVGLIETVEQQWFDSATDLITARNRLKSRLRLIQHGIALANGSTTALPPAVQPDAEPYLRTRYHYHDVNII